jgi:hypothetical protein
MATGDRKISLWDTLRVQWRISVPVFLLGVVVPNRAVVAFVARHGGGRSAMRLLTDLRRKYGCDHLWTWFPLGRTLLVFAPATIDAVLASTDNAPDPALKKRALSRFVPDGLIISSGDEARDRRAFNEWALDLGRLHRHADAFAQIAVGESERLIGERGRALRWADFQRLGERVSQQIIVGSGHVEPKLGSNLASMVRLANLLVRHVPAFDAFYRRIGQLLGRRDTAACLMNDAAASVAGGNATATTCVPSQAGFWFFVLKDAVELHVARTLALLAAHPAVQARVRDEIHAAGPLTAQAIHGLRYLEACVVEQLRLWTPVPILLRRAVRSFAMRGGVEIGAGAQILIPAGYYHRDPGVFGDLADRFSPDAALDAEFPPVYAFSAHGRGCAGRSLVTFVLKATLASLLGRCRFELAGPRVEPGRVPYVYDHFGIELTAVPEA